MERIISPSLLSADFLNLGAACQMLNRSRAAWYHLDIMDGKFVPNISYGMPVIKALRGATDKVLDVHLMIEQPERYVDEFARLGCDVLTIHAESTVHLHRTLGAVRDAGMRVGVALNPSTPLVLLEEVLGMVDMVLLMSVNPGFGGQSFIEASVDKVRRLRAMADERGLSELLIQVDGGVNVGNAGVLYAAGCNVLVAGNAVFGSADPVAMIGELLDV